MILTVISQTADILGDPQEPMKISKSDSQLLYGEKFQVEESHGAYVYGHGIHDNYKGYIEREQLVKDAPNTNCLVKHKSTWLHPEPDFKSRPDMLISFLSHLTTTGKTENGFSQLDTESWVFTDHIKDIDNFKMPEDIAETAMIYLNAPYLYGGRSVFGIDCSGLIQQVAVAHGHDCPPRDSSDQQDHFSKKGDSKNLKRNDIVFFEGHVGIMLDSNTIINATARHMSTVIEKIDALEKEYGQITHVVQL